MTFLNKQPTSESETEAILDDPDALAAVAEAESETPALLYQTERVLTFSSTNDEHTWFNQREDNKIRSLIAIDRETYDDMGEPDTLTVTVRPGDHLNTEDDA